MSCAQTDSVAKRRCLEPLKTLRDAATFLLGIRPLSHLTLRHRDTFPQNVTFPTARVFAPDRPTRIGRQPKVGGNDGNQNEIERARDDDVIRLPRCSRVRHDLVPFRDLPQRRDTP